MSPNADQAVGVRNRHPDRVPDVVRDSAASGVRSATREAFHERILDGAIEVLAGLGGSIWVVSTSGEPQPVYERDFDSNPCAEPAVSVRRQLALNNLLQTGRPQAVALTADVQLSRLSELTSLFCALRDGAEIVAVVEVIIRSTGREENREQALRQLTTLSELFSATAILLRRESETPDSEGQLESNEFARRVHGSLEVDRVAYTIVNECRRIISCDRVSLAIFRRSKCRLTAVSNIDEVDRRSPTICLLENTCAAVAAAGESVWCDGNTDQLAPQIERIINRLLDHTHARTIGITPLFHDTDQPPSRPDAKHIIGVLVVEQFQSARSSSHRRRVSVLKAHIEVALANAVEHSDLPLLRVSQLVATLTRARARHLLNKSTLLGLASLLAGLALLFLPVDFHVHARGQLQPLVRRHLFAPMDAEIEELKVRQNDEVNQDQLVAVLHSPQTEQELQRFQGEAETIRKRLLGIQSRLIEADKLRQIDAALINQLGTEEQEYKTLLASKEQQIELLIADLSSLELSSPIGGQVLTWNPQQLLLNRPVQRGQLLLTFADLDGPWIVELEVPSRGVARMLETQKSEQLILPTSLMIESHPDDRFTGQIQEVAPRADVVDSDRPTVKVISSVNIGDHSGLKPGVTVFAKIHCGRRSLAFVLFHGFADAVRRWIWF